MLKVFVVYKMTMMGKYNNKKHFFLNVDIKDGRNWRPVRIRITKYQLINWINKSMNAKEIV